MTAAIASKRGAETMSAHAYAQIRAFESTLRVSYEPNPKFSFRGQFEMFCDGVQRVVWHCLYNGYTLHEIGKSTSLKAVQDELADWLRRV